MVVEVVLPVPFIFAEAELLLQLLLIALDPLTQSPRKLMVRGCNRCPRPRPGGS